MSDHRSVRELFASRANELCFIVGLGSSLKNAEKHLQKKHPHVFTIAINKAIETVPADYWFWMDLDAYNASKDHPNAKAAIRCGVDKFAGHYDEDTYIWERAGSIDEKGDNAKREFIKDVWDDGRLAYNGVSLVGASNLAWRLGAFRIAYVGCENKIDEDYIKQREAADPSKNWRSIYGFTFARISEALKNRFVWMHPKVMLVDASHTGTEWGDLKLPKTTIPSELQAIQDFYQHLWVTGQLPKKKQLIVRN